MSEREREREKKRSKKKGCAGVRAREKGEKQEKKQRELLLTCKDRGFVWVESRLAATGLLLSVADRRGRVSEGEREKGRVRGCKKERERKGRKTRQKKRALREFLTSKDRGFSDGSRRVEL